MAVGKKRTTKSHQLKRRMNIFLKKPTLTRCLKCGRLILPHSVCSFCGFYGGKEVINVLAKLDKKERKKREKEMKQREKEESKEKPLNAQELSKK